MKAVNPGDDSGLAKVEPVPPTRPWTTLMRAFLAIPLPAEIKNRAVLVQRQLTGALAGIRWVKPANMHLTLKFFPALAEENLEKIGQIMLSVGVLLTSFPVSIQGLGTFPNPARARVFWLGVQGGAFLNQLYERLEQEFEQLGIPREGRLFAPHLTLGRHRRGLFVPESICRQYEAFHGGTFHVDQVVLYQSRLEPSGAIHLPLRSLSLGGSLPDPSHPKKDR
ncbi:MAG: RNA 2',3'-cyclic phosphodiesterase [Desulfuromonadaceae bacterium]|jgi:RNA 2',3'-cyclic 3'-phosphodiesterase